MLKNWRSWYCEIGDVSEVTNRQTMEFESDTAYEEWLEDQKNNNKEVA